MCLYISNIWANYKVSQDRTKLRGGTGSALSCTTKKLETFFVVQGGMLSVPPRFSNIVLVCILPSACNCIFVWYLRKFTNGKSSPHFAWYLEKSPVLWGGILYAKVLFFVCRNYCFWWSYVMFFCDCMICNATYFCKFASANWLVFWFYHTLHSLLFTIFLLEITTHALHVVHFVESMTICSVVW